MTGPAEVLSRAAQVVRDRGLARGRYVDAAGRVDAAGAVFAAAGADLAAFGLPDGPGAGLHPRYAEDPQAGVAWRALCELAAWVDPAFGARVADIAPAGWSEPRLEAAEQVTGRWSDALASADEAAAQLEAAAAKAGSLYAGVVA